MTEQRRLLEVRGVSKTFPGNRALDDVSLNVDQGEIVALLGPNGSGKSTLIKILAGVYEADPGAELGTHRQRGEVVTDAGSAELHFIHQELGLVLQLTTIENLDLSRQLDGGGLRPVRPALERCHAEALISRFGASIDVTVPVERLAAGERAIVAIARAFDGWTHDRHVIVLDEPTAALHGGEVGKLFAAIKALAAAGTGVVFISHRLEEVLELADRVVVLRDGRVVADAPRSELDHDRLVRLIAGADLESTFRRRPTTGEVALEVSDLRADVLAGIDLGVAAGEVLGVSGVLGSGREQLAPALVGEAGATGEVWVKGSELEQLTPRSAIEAGIAYVPGDRRRYGAVLTMSARENLTLPRLAPLRRHLGWLDRRDERDEVDGLIDDFDVRPPNSEQRFELFSGGNQQKVVLAKWLRTEPDVLLLDEPTQGVDVGAKAAIYEVISEAAAAGCAVLVCSSDAEELVEICDRVLVLREGRVVAELGGEEITEARLLREGMAPASAASGKPDRSQMGDPLE